MSEDAVAYVSVVPSFQGGGKAIESQLDGAGIGANIGNSVSGGFLSTVGSIGLGIVKVVGGAVAISGGLIAGLALKGGISRALDIQDAEAKLTGLGHSSKEITGIMNDALSAVQGTAFGLGDAATVAASAVAAGIQPGKNLAQYLTNVADASTIAGVSLSDMGNVFNTVQAGGKAYNQQLEQLAQQGIPIYQYLAKELGTTTDAVFLMASKGQISSAEFGKAIQDNIGGAALSSGKTARGAWDNVLASLSRLGAAITGPAIAAAPGLFVAIEGAVDRADTALTPYIAKLNTMLVPAIASLTTWINGIDFTVVITKVAGFFHAIKDAVDGTSTAIDAGNLSGFFSDVIAVAKPMAPIVVDVAKGLGNVAGSIGTLIAAGIGLLPPVINVLAGALGFLKDNSGLIAPLIIAIAAAMLVYRASQAAANIASLAMIPAYTARTAVMLAGIPASLAAAGATDVTTAAVEEQSAGLVVSAAVWAAQKVGILAGAVATGIATAAQWLFNAALDANPIGIIIIAIAALVAGLIWFFTQTKLGKEIWANMVSFLTDAWTNIQMIATTVFTALAGFFTTVWNGIVSFFQTALAWVVDMFMHWTVYGLIISHWNEIVAFFVSIWKAIVGFIAAYIGLVQSIISSVVSAISSVWHSMWSGISSFFSGIWNGIVSFVSKAVHSVASVIGAVFGTVGGIIKGAFNGVVSFVKGIFNSIISVVNGIITGINAATGVAGAIGIHIGKIPQLPKLANGALINPTPGGTNVTVGEGRWPEAVVPMSPKILGELRGSNDSASNGNSGGDVFNLYETVSARATALQVNRIQVAMRA